MRAGFYAGGRECQTSGPEHDIKASRNGVTITERYAPTLIHQVGISTSCSSWLSGWFLKASDSHQSNPSQASINDSTHEPYSSTHDESRNLQAGSESCGPGLSDCSHDKSRCSIRHIYSSSAPVCLAESTAAVQATKRGQGARGLGGSPSKSSLGTATVSCDA